MIEEKTGISHEAERYLYYKQIGRDDFVYGKPAILEELGLLGLIKRDRAGKWTNKLTVQGLAYKLSDRFKLRFMESRLSEFQEQQALATASLINELSALNSDHSSGELEVLEATSKRNGKAVDLKPSALSAERFSASR